MYVQFVCIPKKSERETAVLFRPATGHPTLPQCPVRIALHSYFISRSWLFVQHVTFFYRSPKQASNKVLKSFEMSKIWKLVYKAVRSLQFLKLSP